MGANCRTCDKPLARGNRVGHCKSCWSKVQPKRREPRYCSCGTRVGKGNTSGRCGTCANRAKATDPEFLARHKAACKRAYAVDPAKRAAAVGRAKALHRDPEVVAKRVAYMREHARALNALSQAARTAETYAKAGRATSAKRLAWCPPELRAEYRALVSNKHLPAAEAREIILAQHERNMAKFRASIGAPDTPQPIVILAAESDPAEIAMHRIAVEHGLSLDAILSDSRKPKVVAARRACCVALHDLGMKPQAIADELEIDRTSVIYHLAQAELAVAA